MKFYIEFNLENSAFQQSEFQGRQEKIRILKNVADRLEMGDISGRIRDINGNTVGCFGIKKGEADES